MLGWFLCAVKMWSSTHRDSEGSQTLNITVQGLPVILKFDRVPVGESDLFLLDSDNSSRKKNEFPRWGIKEVSEIKFARFIDIKWCVSYC